MNHGVAHFHTGWVTIEQQAAGFHLQQRNQFGKFIQIRSVGDQCRGQLALQTLQGLFQLLPVVHRDDDNDGSKDLVLKQFVMVDQ